MERNFGLEELSGRIDFNTVFDLNLIKLLTQEHRKSIIRRLYRIG